MYTTCFQSKACLYFWTKIPYNRDERENVLIIFAPDEADSITIIENQVWCQ